MRVRFLILFSIFGLFSCSKDSLDRIPEAYVNYRITIQKFNIDSKNGLLLVDQKDGGGVAGLIIYKNAENAYVAYDRCSSVNPHLRCAIIPDDPNFTATDPCSGAKFLLLDGSPAKAPAKRSLKVYNLNIINNLIISVSN